MIWALFAPAAEAVRPTDGGLFSFDDADVIQTLDSPDGRVRVHWSSAGPSVTILDDDDLSGVPDYVEAAAEIADDALVLYGGAGFEGPLTEADLGLGDLGGSPALDVYLVDYDLSADGSYGIDRCESAGAGSRCSGYLAVENDFRGYGYSSPRAGLEVVVPHELFHGVQYAYSGELDVWASEGTATWAERLFDPESSDFVRFANAYLEEPTRSIDDPPVGPVPAFAYASCLWWDFLTLRHDDQLLVEILQAWRDDPEDQTGGFIAAIEGRADTLEEAWSTFSAWNLATGARAGAAESYPYATRLTGPAIEATGEVIDDDPRLYPMATTYYRVHHDGGELWFGSSEASTDLVFGVQPTTDGDKDSPVEAVALTFGAEESAPHAVGELPAGHYWVWATQPGDGASSVKLDRMCLGGEADVRACFEAGTTTGTTTGDTDEEEPGGCGCDGTGGAAGGWALGLAVLFGRRRGWRDTRQSQPSA